ncbi:MAG: methyltransferase domain-containing protein [Bacteroidales bacterium]|nr:methyltransferase domain-containing protein [Bacteroidales bacterium]
MTHHNADEHFNNKWDNASWWDEFYDKNKDDTLNIDRDPRYLIKTIEKINRRPPLKILDAGTGISTLPEFAAYLGHHVVAVDISPKAIETGKTRKVTEKDLMRCLGESYSCRYFQGKREYLDRETKKPVDIRMELNKLFHPWGELVAREVMDWNDSALIEKQGTFDIVLNQNGLRAASPELITKSFQSFYRLLNPGGILIETNIIALDRLERLEQQAIAAGFRVLTESWVVFGIESLKVELNDTEKYALFGWPTG